jgi:hypothetical protein
MAREKITETQEGPRTPRALVPRAWTKEFLSTSYATIRRLELRGELDVVRLGGTPKSKAYHRVEQVYGLVNRRGGK